MKFQIGKEAFLEGLQQVQQVVGSKTTLPILSNVMVEAIEGQLLLTTTDLDVRITKVVSAEVTKSGATTLPVKRLVQIVTALPSAEVMVEVDGDDHATITSGPSFFKIIGLPVDEFPSQKEVSESREYELDREVLADALRKTSYAISTDDTRYILNGIFFQFADGKMTLVATDGRRLAMMENELEFPTSHEGNFVLPTKAVRELERLLKGAGDVSMTLSSGEICFKLNDSTLVSKLIEGAYPNYRQVIPGEPKHRMTVQREAFVATANRVALLASEKSHSIRLSFEESRLQIMANTPDVGEARESLDVKYEGEKMAIAFNPDFLKDPLRHLPDEEVHLDLIDEMSPGVLRTSGSFLYVIMPLRLSA